MASLSSPWRCPPTLRASSTRASTWMRCWTSSQSCCPSGGHRAAHRRPGGAGPGPQPDVAQEGEGLDSTVPALGPAPSSPGSPKPVLPATLPAIPPGALQWVSQDLPEQSGTEAAGAGDMMPGQEPGRSGCQTWPGRCIASLCLSGSRCSVWRWPVPGWRGGARCSGPRGNEETPAAPL